MSILSYGCSTACRVPHPSRVPALWAQFFVAGVDGQWVVEVRILKTSFVVLKVDCDFLPAASAKLPESAKVEHLTPLPGGYP
jgi:hypothetical protein